MTRILEHVHQRRTIFGNADSNQYWKHTVTVVGYITATKSMLPPLRSFSNVTTCTMPLSVEFIHASKNSPISWTWSIGDGGTSNDQNPSHTYTNAGTYTVTLTATNAGGSDTDTQTGVHNREQIVDRSICGIHVNGPVRISPLTVQFVDSSANSPASWLWTFGDGSTSIVQNPSHTYANSGIYTVTLTVTNPGAATRSPGAGRSPSLPRSRAPPLPQMSRRAPHRCMCSSWIIPRTRRFLELVLW